MTPARPLSIGQSASVEQLFTADYIPSFAELSGDANPLHTDERFAASTRFGRPIAQGMLGASLISRVIGSQLPGAGTVYLSQSLDFMAPVFEGDIVTARVEVTAISSRGNVATLLTSCRNQDRRQVLAGTAVVLVDG